MQKLIKLNDQHYIIVDNSEIKKGWVTNGVECFLRESMPEYSDEYANRYWKKITHSTQPELLGTGWMQSVLPLFLSEVEEAIYGYSVEKMIPTKFCIPHKHYISKDDKICYDTGFKDGFKAHQELVKDKLFTVEKAIQILEEESFGQGAVSRDEYKARVISKLQSLLPKTEWDIEFDEQGKISLAT